MTSPLRQRQRRAVERQISAAALTKFETNGVQATTLDDIAREAEVSVRTVLRYFPRKEDTALLAHHELRRALQAAVDEAGVAEAPLRTVLDAYRGVLARFDEEDSHVLSALERVDTIKRTEPLLLQAGLRVDAEQTAWLMDVLRERGGLDDLSAALVAETVGVLFRQTLQYWADHNDGDDAGTTLMGSFRVVASAYLRVGERLGLGEL